MNNEDSHWVK